MKAKTAAWGIVVIIVVGAGVVLSGILDPSYETSEIDQADSQTPAQLITRGKYLAMAADCTACHTSKDGAPFAGGVPLATPFGTIYGSNITPDKKNGIGSWTSADFYKVLHDGIAPGHPVYPAMPYTSYRSISRADSDAIFAYLRSIQPVPVANKANDVPFPFNIRALLRGWNFLFLRNSLPDASSGSSDEWVRGKYLANGLGHCTECHTPRGALGQLTLGKTLQGGDLGDIHAVGITPGQLAARGWTTADLQHFLAFGIAPQGSAYGEMHDVVHYSTQHLTQADNKALVRYLTGDTPLSPAALPAQAGRPPEQRKSLPPAGLCIWPCAPAAIPPTARASPMSPSHCTAIPRYATNSRTTSSGSSWRGFPPSSSPAIKAARRCRASTQS